MEAELAPYVIGCVGIIMFVCVIMIQYSQKATKLREGIKHYDDAVSRFMSSIAELNHQKDQIQPQYEELVATLVDLREQRDKLQHEHTTLTERASTSALDGLPPRENKRVNR